MERVERIVATVLFVVSSLIMPLMFTGPAQTELEASSVPFLLQQSMLELKLDLVASQAGNNLAPLVLGDSSGDMEGGMFRPEVWKNVIARMEPSARASLMTGLAVQLAVFFREDEAARLVFHGGPELAPVDGSRESWSCPVYVREAEDAASNPDDCVVLRDPAQPAELRTLAAARFGADGLLEKPEPALLAARLEGFASAVSWIVLVGLGLVISGLGLVVRLGLKLRSRSRSESVRFAEQRRFGLSPLGTFLVFVAWIIGLVVINGLVSLLFVLPDGVFGPVMSTAEGLFVGYGLQALAGVFLVARVGRPISAGLAGATDMSPRDLTAESIAEGLAGYPVAALAVMVATHLSGLLVGVRAEDVNPAIPSFVSAASFSDRLMILLSVSCLAPLFEEFLFRGFLFNQFRYFLSPVHAVGLTALVFAAAHFSVDTFLPLFALGVVLGSVRLYTGSVWSSVVVHAAWNTGTMLSVGLLMS